MPGSVIRGLDQIESKPLFIEAIFMDLEPICD